MLWRKFGKGKMPRAEAEPESGIPWVVKADPLEPIPEYEFCAVRKNILSSARGGKR